MLLMIQRMTPAFSERPKWPFFGLLNIFRPLCSLKGVFLCKKVSFATVLPTRYEHLNLSVKFLFWPSFGLQFYTSLSLASLGAAWCKISGLIPAKKKIYTSKKNVHTFLSILLRKIQFCRILKFDFWRENS